MPYRAIPEELIANGLMCVMLGAVAHSILPVESTCFLVAGLAWIGAGCIAYRERQ